MQTIPSSTSGLVSKFKLVSVPSQRCTVLAVPNAATHATRSCSFIFFTVRSFSNWSRTEKKIEFFFPFQQTNIHTHTHTHKIHTYTHIEDKRVAIITVRHWISLSFRLDPRAYLGLCWWWPAISGECLVLLSQRKDFQCKRSNWCHPAMMWQQQIDLEN